jgi:hypothetical protein
MRDLLYFVIGILLALICIFFDGSTVMARVTTTAARSSARRACRTAPSPGALDVATCPKRHRADARA